ncbi:MAG: cydB [Cyanobacteria bacterium RYN_339]|nr:cydB [Cyanobacteria bacterium RYN_339]
MDLNLFWFFTLGVLLTGYAVLDGFDLGVGTLHLLARGDQERRLSLNSIGPVWDGNEVWLVTFGGALFAAFPEAYASAFSGFYLPFMAVLAGLIFRAVALEFRSKQAAGWWRAMWDGSFFLASAVTALLMGTAVGAIIKGVPVGADKEFAGTLAQLVNPYALLVGVFTVALLALHGGVYLYLKTEGEYQQRVKSWIWPLTGIFGALYMLTTIVTLITIPQATANFAKFPAAWGLVVLNVVAIANVPRAIYKDQPLAAFASSATTIACLVGLFGVAQFPNMITSTLDPAYSLTIYSAASSAKTLGIMQIVVFIGMPFVLAYTAVIYWVFRGKVQVDRHGY